MDLKDEIREVILNEVDGVEAKIGVGFKDLKSGLEVYHNADERFLTASVFKIFVLIELYNQVINGKISLDDRYTVKLYDKSPGSGLLQYLDEGLQLTIRDLAKLMMMISDNTATDILMEILGKENINETVRKLELKDTLIAYNTKEIIFGLYELKDEDKLVELLEMIDKTLKFEGDIKSFLINLYYERQKMGLTLQNLRMQSKIKEAVSLTGETLRDYHFNDVSSPRDIVRTLSLIYEKRILTPEACDEIFGIMSYCQTGTKRLKRYLPDNVIVAHKTGTIPGVVNDVGVILTDRRDYILAVFINELDYKNQSYVEVGENIIANISKGVYEKIMREVE